MYKILGHHHISMKTKNGKENNDFYTKVLGLRRVKKTVNQDDPSMYHLFYGDRVGSAGTELSFFEMPTVGRTHRGTNAITQIGLLVPSSESLLYWQKRFELFGITHGERITYAGREALPFEDSEGLRLILINNNGDEVPSFWTAWEGSTVEGNHRILGMGPIEITVRNIQATVRVLTEVFNYIEIARTESEVIYQAIKGQAFGEIVLKQDDGPVERAGKGSIHHLAIRVKDVKELKYWEAKVRDFGLETAGIIDRFYFQSLYFRDRNGILFELATDGPGFTVDAAVEELGESLDLPPFLEGRRAEIEARLNPLD
ncbi:ring-cleaving dioxygenase [Priestia taiwanensis]|uniref:Glyoxalase n=1 Tax=Priestia taiwanensis TaxID=1347902 RepID=A0A917AP03_9BACI|nr:ring-cleaving dioxygenase [Priestia taiwanensis]MBM7362586.1 glyoxalase family protein [Priestia taiwanensis]GGE63424.1 glyoxalase [Priestia taiwanensis]